MAQECFNAASQLRAGEHWRACVNRAYYAAFSIVTAVLIKQNLTPREDMGTWSHAELPKLVVTHLLKHEVAATNLAFAVRRLYHLRVTADYRPEFVFSKREAMEATALMSQIFRQVKEWN